MNSLPKIHSTHKPEKEGCLNSYLMFPNFQRILFTLPFSTNSNVVVHTIPTNQTKFHSIWWPLHHGGWTHHQFRNDYLSADQFWASREKSWGPRLGRVASFVFSFLVMTSIRWAFAFSVDAFWPTQDEFGQVGRGFGGQAGRAFDGQAERGFGGAYDWI